MTDAEQVACDALRSAGLGELADNLEFAREAVKARKGLVRFVTNMYARNGCLWCGSLPVMPHQQDCEAAELAHALSPEWSKREVELASEAATHVRPRRPARVR